MMATLQKTANNKNQDNLHKGMQLNDASPGENKCDTSNGQQKLLFGIRNTESDKFINSIIFNDQE